MNGKIPLQQENERFVRATERAGTFAIKAGPKRIDKWNGLTFLQAAGDKCDLSDRVRAGPALHYFRTKSPRWSGQGGMAKRLALNAGTSGLRH